MIRHAIIVTVACNFTVQSVCWVMNWSSSSSQLMMTIIIIIS